MPNITVEETVPKGDYGSVEMISVASIFDLKGSSVFQKLNEADYPMTFEQLDQENGFILYEHTITQSFRDPTLLTVTGTVFRNIFSICNKFFNSCRIIELLKISFSNFCMVRKWSSRSSLYLCKQPTTRNS